MHILMLSDFETQGGAAVAASRLAEALCSMGQRVTRLVAFPDGHDHPWHTVAVAPPRQLSHAAFRLLLPLAARSTLDEHVSHRRVQIAINELQPDIINIHNLHGGAAMGWSPSLVGTSDKRTPIVWTLHDMWSFTGRCAYNYNCRQFLSGCGPTCPTPTEHPALQPNLISGAWNVRRRVLATRQEITAVTPSRWLAKEASAGLWAGHRVQIIPYGLPLDIYRPVDVNLSRAALGIPTEGPVLMVAAQDLSDRRKGGGYLVESLARTTHQPLTLLTLGHKRITIDAPNINVHALGYVDHERTKVLAYNAADLFVHPAPADNLPNVVMESLACGTPVVGFPVGGVPDMVRPGQTGWLANDVSAEALGFAIDRALADLERGIDLRTLARVVAESEYSDRLQAERYTALFASLIAQSAHLVADSTAHDADAADTAQLDAKGRS